MNQLIPAFWEGTILETIQITTKDAQHIEGLTSAVKVFVKVSKRFLATMKMLKPLKISTHEERLLIINSKNITLFVTMDLCRALLEMHESEEEEPVITRLQKMVSSPSLNS
ncbi:unnamed protein product [Dovyalis caffra]|uniref:Uncharacterized protein n=1 Tax=Dovyalis caffra TaxID=77055 RepID=A0AAV1S6G8_9ROSI|nr:unnamed protein product [Dovyalis caffra]